MTFIMKKKTQSMWENLFVVALNLQLKKIKRFNQYVLFLNPMSQTIQKNVFSIMFSHKNICAIFGWVKKKLTLKANIK